MKRIRSQRQTSQVPEIEFSPAELRIRLAQALTFHASFDHGPDADFALGDRRVYTTTVESNEELNALSLGLAEPLAIVQGAGRYGAALQFTGEINRIAYYKAEYNVAYSPSAFAGTSSFWLSLDPAEIPGQYSDPVQLTDKSFSDDCIWIDFTKNDTPSDFRLGVFGNRTGGWDVKNRRAEAQEFYWRLLKVEEPPFAKGEWTHVVITWDGLNNTQSGRARLYFNAEYQGASSVIREPFTWELANAGIRLGMGRFAGLIDDIALFNRALTGDEINLLYGLNRGAVELHG